jgi:hypothetical protein
MRLPGERGDTPEPKAGRSDEQKGGSGAAASEEGAAGLAPERLGWSTVLYGTGPAGSGESESEGANYPAIMQTRMVGRGEHNPAG